MGHDHTHELPSPNRAFAIGIVLNVGFVLIEGGFGVWANSLALVADAGHNLSDVAGLLLAWGANYLAGQPPTRRRTYGLRRSSILAALLNAALLFVAIGGIAWEAIRRIERPEPVSGLVVIAVAATGIVVNAATALLFWAGRKHDLNVRGAFLHMTADAGVSAGVVLAGVAIRYTDWAWLDPTASLLIVGVVAVATWGLFRESLELALDAVPAGIDPAMVEAYLASLPSISAVHDLHVWAMSTTEVALTAHLIKPDGQLDDDLLSRATQELHRSFGIEHVTLQLERSADCTCILASSDTNAPTPQ